MGNRPFIAAKRLVLPSFFHNGKTVVDTYISSLMECEVVVEKISIYKSPLGKNLQQASAEQLKEQQGAGLSWTQVDHDFLIVKVSRVQHPTRGELRGFLIRAEKSGLDSQGFAGISVNHVALIEEGAKEHYGDYFNSPIQLKELIDILIAHSPDYDILRDNCWKYADDTYQALEDTLQATRGSLEVQQRQGESQLQVASVRSRPPPIIPTEERNQVGMVVDCCSAPYYIFTAIKRLMFKKDGDDDEDGKEV